MSVAFGNLEYKIDGLVVACGVSHTDEEMESALTTEVYNRVYDITGNSELAQSMLEGLADTGFKKDLLSLIFEREECISSWEVGEAYAQAYLESHFSCLLPWNIKRDIKKSGSSLPGADIVGLRFEDDSVCFLFGEAKTSSDPKYPPRVWSGTSGLNKQLENLCTDKESVSVLIRYLGFRLRGTEHWQYYQEAFVNYVEQNDLHVIGVLIRDVKPDERDLTAGVKSLSIYCDNSRKINLFAIYLPEMAISKFVDIIRSEHERRRSAKC